MGKTLETQWEPWETQKEHIGKPWETHWRNIRKPLDNHGTAMGKHEKTIGKNIGQP